MNPQEVRALHQKNRCDLILTVSGPALEMLGFQLEPLSAQSPDVSVARWDETERKALQAAVAGRLRFLNFLLNRINADGSRQQFRVSDEPMFDQICNTIGYRGVGVELLTDNQARAS